MSQVLDHYYMIIINNYCSFMQRFNIYKARLYHARGFLGKAQAWLKLTILDSF